MTRTFYYGFTNDFYHALPGILEKFHNESHFYLFSDFFLETIVADAEKAKEEHSELKKAKWSMDSVKRRFKTSAKMDLVTSFASGYFVKGSKINKEINQEIQPYHIAELFYYVITGDKHSWPPERTRLVTLEFDWINKGYFFVRDSVHDAFRRNHAAKLLEGMRIENPTDGKRIAVCKRI